MSCSSELSSHDAYCLLCILATNANCAGLAAPFDALKDCGTSNLIDSFFVPFCWLVVLDVFGLPVSGLIDCILIISGMLEGLVYSCLSMVSIVLKRLILELSGLAELLLLWIFVMFDHLMTSDVPAKRVLDSDFLKRELNSGVLIPSVCLCGVLIPSVCSFQSDICCRF